MKLPRTLKGLNALLEQTKNSFNDHKKEIKESGKRYTARDRKSVDFKKRISSINEALKELKNKNELKKIARKKEKTTLTIKPHDSKKKVFDLVEQFEKPEAQTE